MDNEDRQVIFAVGLALTLIFFGAWGLLSFSKSQMKQSCTAFQTTSGYETKYIEYTYFRFDCLAKQDNGKWISTESLRSVNVDK